jgi:hypothetical protein
MSREVRMVPEGWNHPTQWHERHDRMTGQLRMQSELKPLFDYRPKDDADPDDADYDPSDYMPDFPAGTATWFVMYETCSEGTPISPAFATTTELARWLADTGASSFGQMTATYEQWLRMCDVGHSFGSIVISNGQMMSGVVAIGEL